MIIPDFWDEHKEKRKISTRRQATITRFGWADISKADAKLHAKQRVDEAFKKLSGIFAICIWDKLKKKLYPFIYGFRDI